MAKKLVLYFASEFRMLYRWRRNRLELEKHFAPGPEGLAGFRESLGQFGDALLHVVFDLAGEDFHEDRIPQLRGTERRLVIERRLAQRYRDARLAAALSLGATSGERRNERLLLASLPQGGPLAEWLEALLQAPVTIASAVSTGLIAPTLTAELGLGPDITFLVSANSAGLRQSVLEGGRLRFSRLEPMPAGGISPEFARREVERTLEFLENSRALAGARQPFRATLLVRDAESPRFEAALAADGRLAFTILGVGEAARRLRLRAAPEDCADALYLHVAALRQPGEQFLRSADRRAFVSWRLRRAMLAAGTSMLAACTAYAGHLWLEGRTTRAEIASLRQQVAQLRAEEEHVRAQLPGGAGDAEAARAAAHEFRRIVAHNATPEAAWIHVSRALDQAPAIELEALSWDSTEPAGQVLGVSARLASPPQAKYREIGLRVERFTQLLAAGGWTVSGTRLPFDADPQNPVAGDFVRETADRIRFSITLVHALQ